MRFSVQVLLALLFLVPSFATAADGAEAQYVGGTNADIKESAMGRIRITDPQFFQFQCKKGDLRIGYDQINLLEYGQKSDRRLALAVLVSPMFLLSKSRTHFLTIGYTDAEGHQQAMVFRVGKSRVRSVLVSLEARTGRKVEFQDEEARKAGKG